MASPNSKHEAFTEWVIQRGVSIHNIQPAQLPGRGLGIIAQNFIKAGERVVQVPIKALLTTDAIPEAFLNLHGTTTVHGLLASFLAFGQHFCKYSLSAWRATWPSMEDLQSSMPLLWLQSFPEIKSPDSRPNDEQFRLPPGIGGMWMNALLKPEYRRTAYLSCLLTKQRTKLEKDWALVSQAIPTASYADYAYYWFIVNTRSFYCDLPTRLKPLTMDDRMVLCPFIDYFNHADKGCNVDFGEGGFVITTDRDYGQKQEKSLLYLTELTAMIFSLSNVILFSAGTPKAQNALGEDFLTSLSNYIVNSDGVCFRTQVAIRTMTLHAEEWRQYVEGQLNEDKQTEMAADVMLWQVILAVFDAEATSAINSIEAMTRNGTDLPAAMMAITLNRWRQIRLMIREAVSNGMNNCTKRLCLEIMDDRSVQILEGAVQL
ncbi:hypothetical protein MMC13_008487 [Lambiella insularis]|nr:hypothetical protein [Lambiella insularis]